MLSRNTPAGSVSKTVVPPVKLARMLLSPSFPQGQLFYHIFPPIERIFN
jgi:hypothetical protein